MAQTLQKSELILSKDTPYDPNGWDISDVVCEDFRDNWLRYNGTVVYIAIGIARY